MPEFVSHDWHVQPSCQRPIRFPPERRAFSPVLIHTSANQAVLETLQPYSAAANPVNLRIPQVFLMISTLEYLLNWIRRERACSSSAQRATVCVFHSGGIRKIAISAHAKMEDLKLRKDHLEVLALKVPFRTVQAASKREPDVPNQVPWPGQFEGF